MIMTRSTAARWGEGDAWRRCEAAVELKFSGWATAGLGAYTAQPASMRTPLSVLGAP